MNDEAPKGEDGKAEPKSGVPWVVLLIIALLLIGVYVIAVWILFGLADDAGTSEIIWGRYTFLLAGFEAVVFTAVGWLFGREVNRKQAEQAEKATKAAQEKGEEAAEAKAKGEGLKNAILGATTPGGGVGPASAVDPVLLALREQATNTRF